MSWLDAATLAGVMAVLAALPSSSVALVVARTAAAGARAGAFVALGIAAGDVLFALLAISGLAVLAELLGELFSVLRYLAGLYLVWLGVSLLRGAGKGASPLSAPASPLGGLVAGLVVTLGDVKALFFYASLFPAFVDIERLGPGDALLVCVLTAVTVGGVKLAYACAASRIGVALNRHGGRRGLRWGAGGVALGAGALTLAKA